MAHRVSVIDRTVAKTYEWLERLCRELETDDRQHAYMTLRAVLHAMRDRIGPEVSVHLAAQLPLLVRGIFYEGWDPSRTPQRMTLQEMEDRVEQEALLKGTGEAERGHPCRDAGFVGRAGAGHDGPRHRRPARRVRRRPVAGRRGTEEVVPDVAGRPTRRAPFRG